MIQEQPLDELGEALSAKVSSLLKIGHIEGASIAIIRDRTLVLTKGFGLRNSVTGEPITPQSVFEAYSLTKPLVAYMALSLCQKGLLDLDRPLDDYGSTPYISNDHRTELITARRILAHTSGLPDEESEMYLTFTPGEQWSYSTQGYCFLQQVIDRITGERFDETLRRHVLEPMAMASSSFVWEVRFESEMAQGHDAHGIPQGDQQVRIADADSLLTTASDYATFVVECIWPDHVDGDESPAQLSRLMSQPQVAVKGNLHWGLGWGIEETGDGPFHWHIGGGAGAPFQNFVLASRRHGFGIVILTNSANGGTLFEPLIRWISGRDFSLFKFVQDYFYG
jgi:CubicO group peptidase (beta-lactamase class C family)